jgi:hypothetical protein
MLGQEVPGHQTEKRIRRSLNGVPKQKKPPQNMAKRAMRAIIILSILDLLCISHLDESYGMRKNIGPTEIGPGTEVCEKPVQMY